MTDKIKMFIDNEEVVSNHEFTINEEMLSASSTILNNCYPKSWELDRDYITQFYFPKDYSKFILAEGEYKYGNDEFSPLLEVGKNKLPFPYTQSQIVREGITYTAFPDGSVLVNGTATGETATFKLYGDWPLDKQVSFPAKYLSGGTSTVTLRAYTYNGSNFYELGADTGSGAEINMTEYNKGYIELYVRPGDTVNNEIVKPMLLDSLSDTTYVPYGTDISFETNCTKEFNNVEVYGRTEQATRSGKNILNVYYTRSAGYTQTTRGITFTLRSDGGININGTNDGTGASDFYLFGSWSSQITVLSVPSASTFSFTSSVLNDNIYGFLVNQGSVIRSIWTSQDSGSVPANSTIKAFFIRVPQDAPQINNVVVYPQIEVGTTRTSYEMYGLMPSPDFPSEINSVGYTNLIEPRCQSTTANGITFTNNGDGTYTLNGTATADAGFRLDQSTWNGTDNLKNYDAGIYTFTCPNLQNNMELVLMQNSTWTFLGRMQNKDTPVTFKTNGYDNCFIYIWAKSGETINNMTFKPQLIKGSVPNGFVKYEQYGIDVINSGINLFDSSTLVAGDMTNDNLLRRLSSRQIKYIEKGTYTFSTDLDTSIYNWAFLLLPTPAPKLNYNNYYDSGWQTASSKTITFNNDGYICVYVRRSDEGNLTVDDVKDFEFQLQKGSVATEYEKFEENTSTFVLSEPLRQLGMYTDRAYLENGTLKVERKIGSIELSGLQDWRKHPTLTGVYYPNNNLINDAIVPASNSEMPLICCKYFKGDAYDKVWSDNLTSGIGFASNETNNPRIKYSSVNDLSTFKTWLSEKLPVVYYVLKTPIIETVGSVNVPTAYEGKNFPTVYTGIIDTAIDVYYYWKNYNVLFAGIVKNSGDISLNPRHPHYCSLQILDYKTFLSESDTLDYVISNKTIRQAIEMVVNSVSSYGFTVGNIDLESADDMIGAYSTLNKTAYDVLQYLAEISGGKWRARYVSSSQMAIDFYDPENLPQAEDIEYTKQYWEDNNIVDITFNYGTRDYRNKQIILSNEVYAGIEYSEVLLSNGYNTTFITQQNVGIVNSIFVNGVQKDIITTQEKELGSDADFYYTPGKNIIESTSSYTAGTQIAVNYIPLVKGRQIVFNDDEVGRIATQTSTLGIISRYENRNDIVSSPELEQIGETYIKYKGKAEVILTVKTQNNDLYNVGEVVYFNAPIPELQQNYMVKTKQTEYVIIDKVINLFYVYELTSSFNSEKAINYFDNQRNKAQGNIQEGESITRNIDINSSATIIWANSTVSEVSVSVDGDNVLNSVLNSPFID